MLQYCNNWNKKCKIGYKKIDHTFFIFNYNKLSFYFYDFFRRRVKTQVFI